MLLQLTDLVTQVGFHFLVFVMDLSQMLIGSMEFVVDSVETL